MKPLLVTMGDAAGIGPEIIVQAFRQGALADAVIIGDPAVLRRAGAPMTALIEALEKRTDFVSVRLAWASGLVIAVRKPDE